MDTIELLLSRLPQLRHLVLTGPLPLHPPIYSTTPDNTLFYEHINHLILSEMPEVDLHYFHHVKLLDFRSSIPLEILQTKIDFNRVDCLILHSSIESSLAALIPLLMPRLKAIGLYCNMKEFLENARHVALLT
ncbi:unnamed protein product [Rotaria magnacalcarata]|uniref:Uncharacterized protein n=1 Tax=Rotaria magnacalcarata TaxID=392030 RepID=A0A815YLV4_9BILA|nr:unnamed protein product [Rotaria magnacalcarata]CAF1605440.1 unnamed protein product [Rotaria magnacalcarata]CAF4756884.1 unnamed protein product [Rotaria magnacalcarata]CAF4835287.1 unnamed protein product [Rotaria magnacalcarata]